MWAILMPQRFLADDAQALPTIRQAEWIRLSIYGLSYNAGCVKYFLGILPRALRRERHFALVEITNMSSQTIRVGGDRDSPGWVTTPEENDFPGLVSAAIEHLLDRSSASALAWL